MVLVVVYGKFSVFVHVLAVGKNPCGSLVNRIVGCMVNPRGGKQVEPVANFSIFSSVILPSHRLPAIKKYIGNLIINYNLVPSSSAATEVPGLSLMKFAGIE